MGVAKTIRQGNVGKHVLRLVEKDGVYYGLSDGKKCSEGSEPDRVWQQLHDDAGKSDPKFFGYAGARKRFLNFFPNGFHSEGYENQERTYKLAAKHKLDTTAPLDRARVEKGFGEAVLSAFRATNMLSPFEKTRLQDVLRGRYADQVIQAAAAFAQDGDKIALANLDAALKPMDAAKWTVATYLPYLWLPTRHMFLKPEVTKDFATRVGHPFASIYQTKLSIDVYHSLLDLAARTSTELSDLNPRDRVDIQSFIWVVGSYKDEQDGVHP